MIQILDVCEEHYSSGGSAIVQRYDIAEGECKGFFKGQIRAFEESAHVNINCAEDCDPHILKGLLVGELFGNKEYDHNGYSGSFTNLYHLVPVEKIRNGNFEIPKDRLLKRQTIPAQTQQNNAYFSGYEEIISGGNVPF